jgi:uncharacterized protein (TIGR04255 family)
MTFPALQRVLYERNPLEEVICQLRFPPILRIGSDNAAEFQEAIRADYPLYKEEEPTLPAIPLPAELAEIIGRAAQGPKPSQKFLSADEAWTVSLTRDFIALSTVRYERWEHFRQRLTNVVATLERIYRPAFYTRVGLRYRDVIRRSSLGLQDVPWAQLLAPFVAAELSTEIGERVGENAHVALIALEQPGSVRLRHGLLKPDQSGEQSYAIDSDFFTAERTELGDANRRLDYFNQQAARLFRWCITPRLHNAMGPRDIEDRVVVE